MKSELGDMNYSFFNSTFAMQEIFKHPSDYGMIDRRSFFVGFTEVEAACCGLRDLNAKVACIPISLYCSDRTNHVFWDFYHPMEATAGILAADLVDGSGPHVYHVNVRQLSGL
ncbi:GDSL esterase/lipase [Platanthera zijinensis]|uniref:GDSL esterase/lipase n=1 Tax=Platanthera zijinensis TaxID=2320716 RepID=A0AAP0G7J0_9ASPA